MYKKFITHGISILVLVIFVLLALGSASGQSSTKKETKQEMELRLAREKEEREQREEQLAEEQRVREQREREEAIQGYIDFYSDVAGTVLVDGEETALRVTAEGTVTVVLKNGIGTYTLAVKDRNGKIIHAKPVIIEKTGPKNKYKVSIELSVPNSQEDFNVVQNSSGITITSYKGTRKKVIIPDTLYGQKVTVIGKDAFQEKGLLSIVIPNTVITIEGSSFRGAFSGNEYLNAIEIPDSVITIGNCAFLNCGLTTIKIGKGVRFIGGNAFSGYAAYSGAGGNRIEEIILSSPMNSYKTEEYYSDWETRYRLIEGIGSYAFNLGYLKRVTLPSNMHDSNTIEFGSGLAGYYKSQGKKAGAYVKNGPVWVIE